MNERPYYLIIPLILSVLRAPYPTRSYSFVMFTIPPKYGPDTYSGQDSFSRRIVVLSHVTGFSILLCLPVLLFLKPYPSAKRSMPR